MDIVLLRHRISDTLTSLVGKLAETKGDAAPQNPMDVLHQEICQLEQSIVEIATRPSRAIRSPKPITEQQKIIDLAG